MSKENQQKPVSENNKSNNSKSISISKINIHSVKNGRTTSKAPDKPVKPNKGGNK